MKFSRNCSSITSVFTVFAAIFVLWTLGPTEARSHTRKSYQTEDGKECYYCQPGTHKVGDCLESGLQARCEDCSNGFFQSVSNIANSCAHCKTHCYLRNEVLVKNCTSIMDLQCECKEGYYRHGTGGLDEAKCLEHSLCPAGEGVIANGSSTDDTQCEPCDKGTYSADISLSPCQTCTVCADGDNDCSSTNDTVCGSESTVMTSTGKSPTTASPRGLTPLEVAGIAIATFFGGCMITVVVLVLVYRYRKQSLNSIIYKTSAPEPIEDPFVLSVGGYSAITGGCDGENSTEGEQIADTVSNGGPMMEGGDGAGRSSPIRENGQQRETGHSAMNRDIKTDEFHTVFKILVDTYSWIDWPRIIRQLFHETRQDIDNLDTLLKDLDAQCLSLEEKRMKTLQKWKNLSGSKASVEAIKNVLRKLDEIKTLERIEDCENENNA